MTAPFHLRVRPRLRWLLAYGGRGLVFLAIMLIAACDCPWGHICDDFPCDHDFISVAVGEMKAVSVPFCEPWIHRDAVSSARELLPRLPDAMPGGER